MKTNYFKTFWKSLMVILLFCFGLTSSWGQTTVTYTFSTNAWAASPANWNNLKSGNQFQSGRGVQVTTGANGAAANSDISFNNVSKVEVTYSTNASAGAGTINIFSVPNSNTPANTGTRIGNSTNVSTSGGTTDRVLTFDASTLLTGFVQIYVTCSTNSIYVKSVKITYSDAPATPSLTAPASLSGFTYGVGAGPSATQSFTLSGANLTSAVGLLVGDNYEIATSAAGPFSDSFTLPNAATLNTTVYVRLKAGLAIGTYNNPNEDFIIISGGGAADKEVLLSGSVTAPVAATTVSVTSLNGFTYVAGSGPSAAQNFTVSGVNLTGDLVVTAPTNYEVSLTSGSGYGASVSITPASGTVNTTTVYARLKSGLTATTYNGTITVTSTGVTAKNISVSGSVTTPVPGNDLCANAASLTVNAAASNGTLVGATRTAPFNNANTYGINDVWYSFTASYPAVYTITLGGFSGDADFDLFGMSCPSDADDFIEYAATSDNPEVLTATLAIGTYYVRVSGYDTAASNSTFTIGVTAPEPIPAIIVPASVPALTAAVGGTASTTVTVSAEYLTAGISVATSGSTAFTVTPGSLGTNGGTLNVTYTPTVVGSDVATITLTNVDAETKTITLNGTATLAVPTATPATTVEQNSFVANWNPMAGATGYEVDVYTKEGSLLDTDVTVTFANYEFSNTQTFPSGSIVGGFTFTTEKNDSGTDPAYYDVGAGIRLYGNVADGNGNTFTLNIPNNITVTKIDIVKGTGSQASTYAYFVDGSLTAAGSGSFATGVGTNTISSITATSKVVIKNTSTGASSAVRISGIKIYYTVNNVVKNPITGSPFTVAAPATSYEVTGLAAETKYYYAVRATSGAVVSATSNEIEVTTDSLPLLTWYQDADADGFGNDAVTQMAAIQPVGYVAVGGDCNDAVASIYPGAFEVCFDGIVQNCGTDGKGGCSAIITTLHANSCGKLLTSVNSPAYSANPVLPAGTSITGYKFEVTNLNSGAVRELDINTNYFTMAMTDIFEYATTYSVRVAVRVNQEWQLYGSSCTVTTLSIPTTSIVNATCGSELSNIASKINSTPVPSVNLYEFRVVNASNPSEVQTIQLSNYIFNLTMLTEYPVQYATTYQISVRVRSIINGDQVWSNYGTECSVTTPVSPTSQIQLSQCEMTASGWYQNIGANTVNNATEYMFIMRNVELVYEQSVTNTGRIFTLSQFTGLQSGTTYDVTVRVKTYGIWSPEGKVCTITTPGVAPASSREEVVYKVVEPTTDFSIIGYPNPFSTSFGIELRSTSTEHLSLSVYDMTGRLLEVSTIAAESVQDTQFGAQYPAGVYNVVASQGSETRVIRVVKR